MDSTDCCKPERPQKHRACSEALDRLNETIEGLEGLLERIEGGGSEREKLVSADNTSLIDFLDRTPDRVHAYCDRIQKAIGGISTALF